MKDKQLPDVRFGIHKDGWKRIKAKEIFISISDKNHPTLPVLSASQERGMVFRDQIGIDIKYEKDSVKGYKRVKPGQFVIHLRSFQGGFAYSSVEGITSPAYTIIDFKNPEEHDDLFWKIIFSSRNFIKSLEAVTYGIRDGRSISFNDFGTLSMHVPSREEQTKIGSFFKNLDDTISLHQQELEALKQTKQGFLQKMFPRDGESIPELRFPEFISEWHSTKLNNVTNIIGGGTPDTKEPKYWDGEIDWYSPTEIGKNIYAKGSIRKITRLGLEKSSAKILPANKTILFTSRAGIGDTAILVKEGATNQGFQSLVVQDNCDVYFLYSMSNKIKNYALKNASGSTFLEISGKNLGKMSMLIPSMEEQIKIGEFFCQLDEVIELKKKELEALKETKKGFLQKMFI